MAKKAKILHRNEWYDTAHAYMRAAQSAYGGYCAHAKIALAEANRLARSILTPTERKSMKATAQATRDVVRMCKRGKGVL